MNKVTNRQYIKINPADFSMYLFPYPRTAESILRSLEHYLEKNNLSHNLDGENRIVYVDDRNDAMRIGQDIGLRFGLSSVGYFNGEELSTLTITDTKMKRAMSKATVTDIASGEKVSLKKYKKDAQKEIEQKYISFRDISGRKIISPAKLEKLIGDGSLKAVEIGIKRYVDKAELLAFLNRK